MCFAIQGEVEKILTQAIFGWLAYLPVEHLML
jgi:hypothetical protein